MHKFIFILFAFPLICLAATQQVASPSEPQPGVTATRNKAPEAYGVITSASFLYWQPLQDSFDLGKINPQGGSVPTTNVTTKDFDFKYEPGFKVGLGVDFNTDGFSLYGEYTWLYANETTSVSLISPSRIIPSWLSPTTLGEGATNATNHWIFHFNMADLTLRRVSMLGMKLAFVPFVGGRLVFIDQTLNADYIVDQGVLANPRFTDVVSITKAEGWFLGPRMGLDGNWFVGRGVKVIGNFDFAILYGHFKTKHSETNETTSPGVPAVSSHDTVTGFHPNFDFSFGLGWEGDVNQKKQHLDFCVQYDWLFFLESNFLAAVANRTGIVNVCLNGLTLKASVEF